MIEVESVLREWGRSIGVVIPKEAVSHENLASGDTVKLLLIKKSNALRLTFGTLKLKRKTADILKEIDEEGWDE